MAISSCPTLKLHESISIEKCEGFDDDLTLTNEDLKLLFSSDDESDGYISDKQVVESVPESLLIVKRSSSSTLLAPPKRNISAKAVRPSISDPDANSPTNNVPIIGSSVPEQWTRGDDVPVSTKRRPYRASVLKNHFVYDRGALDEQAALEAEERARESETAAKAAAEKAARESNDRSPGGKSKGDKKGKPAADAKSKKPLPSAKKKSGEPDSTPPITTVSSPPRPPIWDDEPQYTMVIHEGRPWLIENVQPKHWFDLGKMEPPAAVRCEPQDEGKYTATGERIAKLYHLKFVIKEPETAALFLMQRNKSHVVRALRTLFLFAEQSTRLKLRIVAIPGLVRRLVQIIKFRGGIPQRWALMLLASLSEVKMTAHLFKQHGGLEAVRNLFTSLQDPDHCVWLSLLIRNLSQRKFYQEQIIRLDIIEIILDSVSKINQHPDVVRYNLQTLYFLCWNPRIRKCLVVRGGFVAIVDLINSSVKYLQYLALVLTEKLLRTTVGLPIYRFHKCDGVQIITDFLFDINNKKLFSLAIDIVEFIRQAPAIARQLQEMSFFRNVVEAAVSPSYSTAEDLQEYALELVCHAAKDENERRTLHSLAYEEHIVTFLRSCSIKVRIGALKAIAVLSRRPTNQETFYALGTDRLIMTVIQHGHLEVNKWGLLAVAFLMFRNKSVTESLLSQGLIDYLYNILDDSSADNLLETKANALLCAILLRKRPEVIRRLRLSVARLIPHWLVHEDARIRSYAATAISVFVTDADARDEFTDNGGHMALANAAVMDQAPEFLRNVCFGLASLAVNEDALWELVCADSLKALFLLKHQLDRVSQGYAAFLVYRIVKLGTFFKFAFIGYLDDTDHLPHGLHDQGTLSLSNPLRRIESFLDRGLDSDRTVIYISLPKKYWRRPQFAVCYMRDDGRCSPTTQSFETLNPTLPVGLQRLEDAIPLQDLVPEVVYNPNVPPDGVLKLLMRSARNETKRMDDMAKIEYLAEIVVREMGGIVRAGTGYEDDVELSLAFVRRRLQSCCVPLGMVKKGNGLHRAVLFKVLADVSGLKVSLRRGECGRGWNEWRTKEEVFIVDLLYSVGNLLANGSELAAAYIATPIKLPEPFGSYDAAAAKMVYNPTENVVRLARQRLLQSLSTPRYYREDPKETIQPPRRPGKTLKLLMDIQKESTDATSSVFHHKRHIIQKLNEFIKGVATARDVHDQPMQSDATDNLTTAVDAPLSDTREMSAVPIKDRQVRKVNK